MAYNRVVSGWPYGHCKGADNGDISRGCVFYREHFFRFWGGFQPNIVLLTGSAIYLRPQAFLLPVKNLFLGTGLCGIGLM
jgi:hypothetical protein